MSLKAGIVCGKCDLLNSINSSSCSGCGNEFSFKSVEDTGSKPTTDKQHDAAPNEGEPMEQAKHLVCSDCYTPVPAGHKFCGKCGKSLEDNTVKDPNFFGELQTPGKAKLILIKGEGVDGMSYHLNSQEHKAGRSQGEITFDDDDWLSPVHANFKYVDGQVVVVDENSVNGVFVAVKDSLGIAPGTIVMAGEQTFRVESFEPVEEGARPDGTYFYASPFEAGTFRVIQILEGGGEGMIVNPKDGEVKVGRENCDMNFPSDPFLSGSHVKFSAADGQITMTDLDSKNGTFVRINGEQVLNHGDYLFMGRQLLRIEITG